MAQSTRQETIPTYNAAMADRPHALVLTAPGINCDEELCEAFALAGAEPTRIHINRLAADPSLLEEAELIGLPGGFSYGDGCGRSNCRSIDPLASLGRADESRRARCTHDCSMQWIPDRRPGGPSARTMRGSTMACFTILRGGCVGRQRICAFHRQVGGRGVSIGNGMRLDERA